MADDANAGANKTTTMLVSHDKESELLETAIASLRYLICCISQFQVLSVACKLFLEELNIGNLAYQASYGYSNFREQNSAGIKFLVHSLPGHAVVVLITIHLLHICCVCAIYL